MTKITNEKKWEKTNRMILSGFYGQCLTLFKNYLYNNIRVINARLKESGALHFAYLSFYINYSQIRKKWRKMKISGVKKKLLYISVEYFYTIDHIEGCNENHHVYLSFNESHKICFLASLSFSLPLYLSLAFTLARGTKAVKKVILSWLSEKKNVKF